MGRRIHEREIAAILGALLLVFVVGPLPATSLRHLAAEPEDIQIWFPSPPSGSVRILAGDISGDGQDDLVIQGFSSTIELFVSPWTLGPEVDLADQDPPSRIQEQSPSEIEPLGDVDGDGIEDLILAWRNGVDCPDLLLYLGRESWPASVPLGLAPPDVRLDVKDCPGWWNAWGDLQDVDRDGIMNLVAVTDQTSSGYTMEVWLGRQDLPALLDPAQDPPDLRVTGLPVYTVFPSHRGGVARHRLHALPRLDRAPGFHQLRGGSLLRQQRRDGLSTARFQRRRGRGRVALRRRMPAALSGSASPLLRRDDRRRVRHAG